MAIRAPDGANKCIGYDGMNGYCGHITHLSVVSDFEILIFCLFIYFLVRFYPHVVLILQKLTNVSEEKLLFVFLLKLA